MKPSDAIRPCAPVCTATTRCRRSTSRSKRSPLSSGSRPADCSTICRPRHASHCTFSTTFVRQGRSRISSSRTSRFQTSSNKRSWKRWTFGSESDWSSTKSIAKTRFCESSTRSRRWSKKRCRARNENTCFGSKSSPSAGSWAKPTSTKTTSRISASESRSGGSRAKPKRLQSESSGA